MSRAVTLYRDPANRFGIAHGDALEVLRRLPEACVDAVVTDPPYGIGFKKQAWDLPGSTAASGGEGFAAWTREWAAATRRVLKPGGHLVAFGAPRTYHRLAVGIEDAGLEIRDQLVWLCGQGVPKGRRWPGGYSTTLRPGYEPIVLARAPLATGASKAAGLLTVGYPGSRWPQNVVLTHTTQCSQSTCSRHCPLSLLDRQHSSERPSRFFYAPKASRREREAGCDQLPAIADRPLFGADRHRARPRSNTHPTVKPVELMRWLVRLTCPEDGVVLDPFTGSGSTGAGAMLEGRSFIGIEREPEYVEIACARLAHWSREL